MATQTVPVEPERKRTPEEIEREWFETVYQGDRMRQFTPRVMIMGAFLAVIMACSNVYVSLKVGWTFGVGITSCILYYTFFAALRREVPKFFPAFSILENNSLQSVASSAGSMPGGGVSNAIPALMMLNATVIPAAFATRCLWLIPWVTVVSLLGVFLAVPAKRQMINVEKLPFPTGIATATTLRGLHTQGEEAARQAKSLGLAGLLGAGITWLRDADFSWMIRGEFPWGGGAHNWAPVKGWFAPKMAWLSWLKLPRIESTWGTNGIVVGTFKNAPLYLNQVTMSLEGSLLFIAGGALISFRQAWSMMLGAIINYVILAPMMLNAGVIEAPSFRKISAWSLWTGVPMMVTSGLLLFFMNWKTAVRAFSTIGAFLQRRPAGVADPMDRIEVPGSWFIAGFAVLGLAAIVLGNVLFHIQWWMGLIAVIATFFLVVVAARATGETDITPVGPLSKITQLTFGAISPGNITTNLMTANISAGATAQAGDLLTDLKSGYLLGAIPRQQFLAQFMGVLVGGFIVVPVFFILIPDVSMLATEKWPAPAALVWRAVAELLSKGVGSLHPTARWGIVIGGTLGIILPLLEIWLPRYRKFIPGATGLGLAFTVNGFNSVSFFIGACLAALAKRLWPKPAGKYIVPASSGIIAGESLMGVLIAFGTIFKVFR